MNLQDLTDEQLRHEFDKAWGKFSNRSDESKELCQKLYGEMKRRNRVLFCKIDRVYIEGYLGDCENG